MPNPAQESCTDDNGHIIEAESPRDSDPPGDVNPATVKAVFKIRRKCKVDVQHTDLIKNEFWEKHPWILQGKNPKKTEIVHG